MIINSTNLQEIRNAIQKSKKCHNEGYNNHYRG